MDVLCRRPASRRGSLRPGIGRPTVRNKALIDRQSIKTGITAVEVRASHGLVLRHSSTPTTFLTTAADV